MEKNELLLQKKVTVFSTMGKNAQEFTTSATTWGELQSNLKEMKITFQGMKAVIGENKHTLESDKALLPSEGFTLYLMPVKTKSGADRKALMAAIKEFVTANPGKKSLFIIDGKNMTQLSTDTLETLVAKHIGKNAEAQPATKKQEAPEVKKETPKAKAKAEAEEVPTVNSLVATIDKTLTGHKDKDIVLGAVAQIVALLGGDLEVVVSESTAVKKDDKPVESEADRKAREEKERQEQLNRKCSNELDELMNDFKDVRR